jgi:hypothetical protein
LSIVRCSRQSAHEKVCLSLLLLLFYFASPARATHVVGGELSRQAKGSHSSMFELRLPPCFDALKGEHKAQDTQTLVAG